MNAKYKTYLTKLQATALNRKPGYLDEALKLGKSSGAWIEFNPEQFHYLREKYYLPPPPKKILPLLSPLPPVNSAPDNGPASVASRKKFKLGDAVHAIAGPVGRALGVPCIKRDGSTDLIPGTPCYQFRQVLNKITL